VNKLGWATAEISVRATESTNDAKLFTLKVNGIPPIILEGITLEELIVEIKKIYGSLGEDESD
jgi:hypothetical protein